MFNHSDEYLSCSGTFAKNWARYSEALRAHDAQTLILDDFVDIFCQKEAEEKVENVTPQGATRMKVVEDDDDDEVLFFAYLKPEKACIKLIQMNHPKTAAK